MASSSLRVWQLVDSAFPSGGFTHSGGLEAAVQHGEVRSVDDLFRVAAGAVCQAGWGGLPLVSAAHAGTSPLEVLDARADAFLNQTVGNRASRAMGRALLSAARRVFADEPLQSLAERAGQDDFCGHHAPLFGAVMAALGVGRDETCRLFLFQAARGILSAAVRLGLVGVFDTQRLQAALGPQIDRTVERARGLAIDDLAQTTPMLDLFQSTQDRLYSRLFQS